MDEMIVSTRSIALKTDLTNYALKLPYDDMKNILLINYCNLIILTIPVMARDCLTPDS